MQSALHWITFFLSGNNGRMKTKQQLLFVIYSCLLCSIWGVPPQTFLRQPNDQTAKVGDHVTLPCQVTNKKGMLQWTRDGFGLGVERNLTGFDRYHMSGMDEEGNIFRGNSDSSRNYMTRHVSPPLLLHVSTILITWGVLVCMSHFQKSQSCRHFFPFFDPHFFFSQFMIRASRTGN